MEECSALPLALARAHVEEHLPAAARGRGGLVLRSARVDHGAELVVPVGGGGVQDLAVGALHRGGVAVPRGRVIGV